MNKGLIKREDVSLVCDRANLEEIVSEHVTLRSAGLGRMKGLCPFHDEKTASFTVQPALGRYHCFGCGEGGDVISFVQKINHMSFTEAVEYLAARYSVQLRYEDAAPGRHHSGPSTDYASRQRLFAANEVAEEFFRSQLFEPEAEPARRFLQERDFGPQSAKKFGVGYAPQGWDSLLRHLRFKGFTEEELVMSGLVSRGQRGVYDRFRGRLIWPIRDVTGKTIGFGARRLYDDDQGPKYLNTPETPIYKKSQVLYGLDLAKKNISAKRQVVIMEGYTDVMAAHEAGIDTAVASCGTAFGSEHVTLVRRIMGDHSRMSSLSAGSVTDALSGLGGEVIFTFDGDAAGQAAALKAFNEDQRFIAQTYVAVDPQGMDPCDIRLHRGNEALARVIELREPLFEFVIKAALRQVDLNALEGRIAGLRMAAPIVAQIRDQALRPEYARRLSGWVGLDERTVQRSVQEAGRAVAQQRRMSQAAGPSGNSAHADVGGATDASVCVVRPARLDDIVLPHDPVGHAEAQALAVMLQAPHLLDPEDVASLPDEAFRTVSLQSVWDCILASGMLESAMLKETTARALVETVLEIAGEIVRPLVEELASLALPARDEQQLAVMASSLMTRLRELSLTHEFTELRRKLGQVDSAREPEEFAALMRRLQEVQIALHSTRESM